MLEVKYLISLGYNNAKIADILQTKPYRVDRTLKTTFNIKYNQVLKVQEYLFDLDYQIKSGNKDPYYAFELFLINFNDIAK